MLNDNIRNNKELYQSMSFVKGDEYSNAVGYILNSTENDLDVLKDLAIKAVDKMKACGVKGKNKRIDIINSFTTASKLKWYLYNSAGFGQANYDKIISSK